MLIAVSGGADSMALLHGVLRIAGRLENARIEVAHLNHGLRGTESDEDLQLVQDVCGSAEVICNTDSLSPGSLQQDSRGSLEESARAARYAFLHRIALERGLPLIVTAHHQQDQLETILFSLLRGTGLRGLGGIPETRDLSPGVKIVRPMLRIEKETVRKYVASEKIAYREDSSNQTAEFARNRIRLALQSLSGVPGHGSELARFTSCLLRLGQQAKSTMQVIDCVSEQILAESLREQSPQKITFDCSQLRRWPEPLIRHALILQWSRQQWPRRAMTTFQWHQLSQAASTGSPRRWSFPDGVRMSRRRDALMLEK